LKIRLARAFSRQLSAFSFFFFLQALSANFFAIRKEVTE